MTIDIKTYKTLIINKLQGGKIPLRNNPPRYFQNWQKSVHHTTGYLREKILENTLSGITGGKILVDSDGSVVICGQHQLVKSSRCPFFYCFDEESDTICSKFVKPEPNPWYYVWSFGWYKSTD